MFGSRVAAAVEINVLPGKIRRKDMQLPPPTGRGWSVEHPVHLHVRFQVPGGKYNPYEETGLKQKHIIGGEKKERV